MSGIKIWHNPRCSKSRETLALLRENGVEPDIIDYQKNPPNAQELSDVIGALGIATIDLMRRNEPEFKAQKLGADCSDEDLISAMIATPRLIERPIVLNGAKAAIGRPPEAVLRVL